MDTNSKIYWIIVNGQPQGPFTPDEIAARGVASPTLRVWRKGLPEWVQLSQIPELAQQLGVDGAAEDNVESEEPAVAATVEAAEEVKVRQPFAQFQTQWQASWGAAGQQQTADYEPMPPTYLPWNVLVTICCCIPVGIAGVIFSSQVSRKYYRGDLEGARQASERAAWCFIIAFTLGLVLWPFQMLFGL